MNPFPITHYGGPANFCDRNQELSTLIEAFENQRHCLLHAIRRIGKTGLIHHFHHHLKRKKVITIYFDILDTTSDQEFINKMIQACIANIENKKAGIINRISKYFSRLRPILTFDPLTGVPEIELDIKSPHEIRSSMAVLAEMLGQMKQPIQIAIDEFQQIANYESTVIDASIRSQLHKMPNVHFIFSGSQRHLLIELFNNTKKAMFSAVQSIQIGHIESAVYQSFILKKFKKAKIKIDEQTIDEILEWTYVHTFYTQFFCNRLYAHATTKVTPKDIGYIKKSILKENEMSFLSYRHLLSKNQLKVVKGIAIEGSISVLDAAFLSKNHLAESSARQALKTLLDKEIIYQSWKEEETFYFVYDPFFSRWLSR